MSDSNLLPVGFYDSFGEIAKRSYIINNKIIDYLLSNGFELFIPSPVEYSDLANIDLDKKFTVLDPLSDNHLTIRSDITSQVHRAVNYSDLDPLNICYSGVVLRLNNDKNNHSRSFKQVGFEILSKDKDFKADELAFSYLCKLLELINVKSYKIIFSSKSILDFFRDKLGFDDSLIQKITSKNDINLIFDSCDFENIYEYLAPKDNIFFENQSFLTYDTDFKEYYEAVNKIFLKLPKNLAKSFVFDPLNFQSSNYNSGNFFSIIDNETNNTIVRGGEYFIKNYGFGFGASFYMEEIV
ncbi:MAG: ATP phosphoribosyltransferase regulatory subunit [Rickettsiales bacterium]|nr:ATP phosphoribosyltransferase regulatory subunit [Rickettsiales bacterium]